MQSNYGGGYQQGGYGNEYGNDVQLSPGREMSGLNLQRKAGPTGTIFSGDLSAVGSANTAGDAQIFAPDETNILSEERRLIEKVFSIVDKDNSGTIDAQELEVMFKLFGVETHFLNAAIERVMANVSDAGNAGQISPEEFYKLLSAKFSKGDSEKEMEDVFDRMGAKHGLKSGSSSARAMEPEKELGIEELHKVAHMLGETQMTKPEIKDMIRCFKRLSNAVLKPEEAEAERKKNVKPPPCRSKVQEYTEKDEKDPQNVLNVKEFIAIMNLEL